jgi:gliding motility-associated lipoprotein GldH
MSKIFSYKLRSLLLPIACCLLLFSCTQLDIFEKNTAIPNYQWQSSFAATGNFAITDTAAPYNIFLVLRHTDAYRYNNIWLDLGFSEPGDSMHYQKLDLALATDAEGWHGSGMNDIWEVRKLLGSKRFSRKGTYSFTIKQIMRDNPLLHIMSVGLRVERVKT